eukprot:1147141-Pelagomonas_calceolata.AAC.1
MQGYSLTLMKSSLQSKGATRQSVPAGCPKTLPGTQQPTCINHWISGRGSKFWRVVYTPHALEPFKELDLETYTAIKLALKLCAHSVQYAYKLASTRRALEKASFYSCQQDQARGTASIPPDSH